MSAGKEAAGSVARPASFRGMLTIEGDVPQRLPKPVRQLIGQIFIAGETPEMMALVSFVPRSVARELFALVDGEEDYGLEGFDEEALDRVGLLLLLDRVNHAFQARAKFRDDTEN